MHIVDLKIKCLPEELLHNVLIIQTISTSSVFIIPHGNGIYNTTR